MGVADLALTGQAVFDWEALRGRVDVGRRELSSSGVDAAYAVEDTPTADWPHTPGGSLAALAARVARTWSR